MSANFGKYELLERIAQGSLAEIFRGRTEGEAGFEKTVVIKRILPEFSVEDDFVEAFVEVATVTATLTHANICQIYDFGCIDGRYFICMEYVRGRDLLAIQRRSAEREQSPLPLPMVLRVVLEVCKALEYAHEMHDHAGQPIHIVHRSISPPNVLVSLEGAVKVINFGTAKSFASAAMTAPASTQGQFAHIAPEQIAGKLVDGRSDLFSLGILTWELLTGQDLFRGRHDPETLENVRSAQVRPPSELNPAVPGDLDAIVLRLLKRDPSKRYPSAEELHTALEACIRSLRIRVNAGQLAGWMQELYGAEAAQADPAAANPVAAAVAERRRRPTPVLRPPAAAHGLTPIPLEGESQPGPDDEGTRVSDRSAELAQAIAGERLEEDFVEDESTLNCPDAAEIIAQVDMQRAASRGEVAGGEEGEEEDPVFFDEDATEIDPCEPEHWDPDGVDAVPSAEVVISLPSEMTAAAPELEAGPEPVGEPAPQPFPRRGWFLPMVLLLLLALLGAFGAIYLYYGEDPLTWLNGLLN